VNAARGNFYPAAKSPIIDSGLGSLEDRNDYTAVTQPLGIPLSPIIAPGRDLYGQLRSDDPGQGEGFGEGGDVFKDRGAIDRVDFVQPSATLAVPLDGSTVDQYPDADQVLLVKGDARGIAKFELQLGDVGVGIDKATVISEAFEVRRNETLLVAGIDYTFNYLESSNRVVFEAAAIYPMGSYVISVVQAPVNGVPTNVITDLAGNPLLPNNGDGTTSFAIDLADGAHRPRRPDGRPAGAALLDRGRERRLAAGALRNPGGWRFVVHRCDDDERPAAERFADRDAARQRHSLLVPRPRGECGG
jgi:hypothetical protein